MDAARFVPENGILILSSGTQSSSHVTSGLGSAAVAPSPLLSEDLVSECPLP